jgi:dTDP-glucose 4,6-dehydratase
MNILVTGGAGFIGSNYIRYVVENRSDDRVVNLDKLTYAGNLENLKDIEADQRYEFVHGDICDAELVQSTLAKHRIEAVVHFAAESHVDRSIMGGADSVRTNVLGTEVLLEAAKGAGLIKFVHISTDEVYGSLGNAGRFVESTPLHPNSPYSASKASSDLLALAYHHTFGLPIVVTRCSNNYGPYQFPEKLIPLMVVNAMNDKSLPIYGDGGNVRDWIHVLDHCTAIDTVLRRGKIGSVYNIGGSAERKNLDVAKLILKTLGKPESLLTFVKDRPGHDRRYAIDSSKIEGELQWRPRISFEEGLVRTVAWYQRNPVWWQRIINGEYKEYYKKMYEGR